MGETVPLGCEKRCTAAVFLKALRGSGRAGAGSFGRPGKSARNAEGSG